MKANYKTVFPKILNLLRRAKYILVIICILGMNFLGQSTYAELHGAEKQFANDEEQFEWVRKAHNHFFPIHEPKLVTKDYAKHRFSPPPKPGIHPRVYFNPEDVPAIKKRMQTTKLGKAADKAIRAYVKRVLENNEIYDNLAAKKTGKVFEANFKKARWDLALGMMYKGFLCIIDNDSGEGRKLGSALAHFSSIVQLELDDLKRHKDDPLPKLSPQMKEFIPHGWDWQTIQEIIHFNNLALCYDFNHKFMTKKDRSVVRKMISKSSKNIWSHSMGRASLAQANWTPYHWRAAIQALCIEGEEGFDQKVVDATVRSMKQFYTYGVSEAGSLFENLGKGSFGTHYLPPFAKRGYQLLNYTNVKKLVSKFSLHSTQPWGGLFHTYGGHGSTKARIPLSEVSVLKYAYPDDPAIEVVYRNSMNFHITNGATKSVSSHPAYMYDYIYYA
ncbi:MAG: hypothetical protein NE330_03450, partial [Lentisphaeraceae bacterium]|nr:hypothetical protein [Lentisphaeraceae bacterium]